MYKSTQNESFEMSKKFDNMIVFIEFFWNRDRFNKQWLLWAVLWEAAPGSWQAFCV